MKIRCVVVVAVLIVTSFVPTVAQAQVEQPRWAGSGIVERLAGWIGGLWSAVARSESDGGGETVEAEPEGPSMTTTSDDPAIQGEVFPELDPDG